MDKGADKPLDSFPSLDQAASQLAAHGLQRRFRKGMHLINEGERGDTLFVVLSGRVKAYSVDSRDREITYGVYGPGETLGEMSLDGGPRSANVMALEPTVCSVVTRQTLLAHIARHPEFALELLAKVIGRARVATLSARNMALLDVYGRVVQLLESLAVVQADGSHLIASRLTHAEIASRIGCSREMVSRLLKDLEVGGYFKAEEQHMLILRPLPARW
jgi:CRP/FNR family cyclic AMP-dependent transcriptional regulator